MLERARTLSGLAALDILEGKQPYMPVVVADIRRWLSQQPVNELLPLDFQGVRALTASFAIEVGPLLMQMVARDASLHQRYPIYKLDQPEHIYTFALVFSAMNWTALGLLDPPVERSSSLVPLGTLNGSTIVAMGSLTEQMEHILLRANEEAEEGYFFTSETLADIAFLRKVSAGARSKRLTDLYERRLLGLLEKRGHVRHFAPTWKLGLKLTERPKLPVSASPFEGKRARRKRPGAPAAGILRLRPQTQVRPAETEAQ